MSQIYTKEEVAENNGQNGKPVWMIIKGIVYDVTGYMSAHPGGESLLMDYAGKDATKAFNEAGHSSDAVKDLKCYKIGELTKDTPLIKPAYQKSIIDNPMTKEKRRIKLFFCF